MRPASTVLIMQLSNSRMGDDGVPVDVMKNPLKVLDKSNRIFYNPIFDS